MSAKPTKPVAVMVPPPDSAVRLRMLALLPLKTIVPLALESPLATPA